MCYFTYLLYYYENGFTSFFKKIKKPDEKSGLKMALRNF